MKVSKDQVELIALLNRVFQELYKEAKEAGSVPAPTRQVASEPEKRRGRKPRQSDPILRALGMRKSGYDVGTLASIAGWAPGYASAHITKLAAEGLVEKRRDGQRVIVTLADKNRTASQMSRAPDQDDFVVV